MVPVSRFVLEAPEGPRARTEILVGCGALDLLAGRASGRAALVVTDENVARTPWPSRVEAILRRDARLVAREVLQPGESAKVVGAVADLWRAWSDAGAGRDSVVVAVGGGVVTDVAGFAAATYLRGVAWIAVPTTVLAMADAALGGKVGVNTPRGKNLAGAIHHPELACADPSVLATLPESDYVEGWAEVLKAGVIGDASLVEDLTARAPALAERDVATACGLIERSARVKARIVSSDDRERSRREILNFGHTVAHALEHATAHAVSHGRAVAIGMVAEARLAVEHGWLPRGTDDDVASACRALGLPDAPPRGLDEAALRAAFDVDKKRRAGRLRLALPEALGAHGESPGREVDEDDVIRILLGRG